jgi:hypothetical protein
MSDSTKPEGKPVKLTIADTKSAYEVKSTKASDIVRQLSLAGIGLIWVFKVGEAKDAGISLGLLRGALFIFAALTFDLLQYLVGTVTWYLYFRRKEKERHSNTHFVDSFEAPEWINTPTWILFWLKAVALLIAYFVYIIPFLISKFVR